MPRKPRLSIDQGIKELLQLRPRDTFAFLLSDAHAKRGDPLCWEFPATQVRKKDLRGKGYVMDLCIRYEFAEGSPILLVLVEHWSQARSMDLIRTAHYYLDLMERYPGEEIIPVALVTELEPHEIQDAVAGGGNGEEFLRFRTRVMQLATEPAKHWAATANLVALTMLLAMQDAWHDAQGLLAAADAFQGGASDEELPLLYPLFVAVGKLDEDEEETIMSYLSSMPKTKAQLKVEEKARAEGIEQGLERGIRTSKLEDARKMREHGIEWSIVTDITGITPKDLA